MQNLLHHPCTQNESWLERCRQGAAQQGGPRFLQVPPLGARRGQIRMAPDVRIWIITILISCCRAADILAPSGFATKLLNQGQVDILRPPGLLDLHGHPTHPESSMSTPNPGELSAQ